MAEFSDVLAKYLGSSVLEKKSEIVYVSQMIYIYNIQSGFW
jgi:hypothetical protein